MKKKVESLDPDEIHKKIIVTGICNACEAKNHEFQVFGQTVKWSRCKNSQDVKTVKMYKRSRARKA